MKTKFLLIIFSTVIIFSINSCKSKQQSIKSDSEYYRADARATSNNREASREKALFIAKQRLASLIQSSIESKTINSSTPSDTSESAQEIKSLTQKVINQNLVDIKIINEETHTIKGGKYESYIALEVSRQAIHKELIDK